MVADSAITYYDDDGNVDHVDERGWQKLFRVPSAHAGISYWGHVGAVRTRFDEWIGYLIRANPNVKTTAEIASLLATEMNKAASNIPIKNPTGVHVAGFMAGLNGISHPVVYHVHNGHGHFELNHVTRKWGWVRTELPKLFTVHLDFFDNEGSQCYLLRNGEFFLFSQLWAEVECAVKRINSLDGIRIPSRQNDLGSFKGYMHTLVKMVVDLYRISNLHRSVGGRISSIGITRDSYLY